jgi:hypothetical protein
VNLLGGRTRVRHLNPLTIGELGRRFDLVRTLHRGLLPSIYFSDDPEADLQAYAGTYLHEEVVAKGVATLKIPAFTRFLKVAALNSTLVNCTTSPMTPRSRAQTSTNTSTLPLRPQVPPRPGGGKEAQAPPLASLGPRPRRVGEITILPYRQFLDAL